MLHRFLNEVRRFHQTVTGMPIPEKPEMLTDLGRDKRRAHLREELEEFELADNAADQADALLDLAYVALGGLLQMGICPGPAFDEVQRANMDKVPGGTDEVKRCVKPDGWNAPDLSLMLSITQDELATIKAMRNGSLRFFPLHDDLPVVPRKPKILVLGHARHGKDTVCEYLRDVYGFTFTSSSHFCAERVVRPALEAKLGIVYEKAGECMARREEVPDWRKFWYDAIRDFNRPDLTALGRAIWAENDIYCGLRHHSEFNALKNTGSYDLCLWVDAHERKPMEEKTSMSLEQWMADYTIDSNGTIPELHANIDQLMKQLSIGNVL